MGGRSIRKISRDFFERKISAKFFPGIPFGMMISAIIIIKWKGAIVTLQYTRRSNTKSEALSLLILAQRLSKLHTSGRTVVGVEGKYD